MHGKNNFRGVFGAFIILRRTQFSQTSSKTAKKKESFLVFCPEKVQSIIGNYKLSNLEKSKKSDLIPHYNLGCI